MKTRLYKYLIDSLRTQKVDFYTAPEIKRNIENYGVYIDGVIIHRQLEWVGEFSNVVLDHWPRRMQGDLTGIRIVYENPDTLVIFKPVGVPTERGAGHQSDTVLDWLAAWVVANKGAENLSGVCLNQNATYEKLSNENISNLDSTSQNYYDTKYPRGSSVSDLDPKPVHRIDKDTQGILLIAKNTAALNFYQNQFRERSVNKKYLALVESIVDQNLIVNNWQARDRFNLIRQKLFWDEYIAKEYDAESRNAKSIIKPLYTCKVQNQSIVEISILTGRMHQIRLQCEALGLPLVSEKIYNEPQRNQMSSFESNSKNQKIWTLQPVADLSAQEFEAKKIEIFGQSDYCLLSAQLEIRLTDGRLALFSLI